MPNLVVSSQPQQQQQNGQLPASSAPGSSRQLVQPQAQAQGQPQPQEQQQMIPLYNF
jgi:hypothetical protein